MAALEFDLPWPVTTNACYRNLNGRTLISRRGRQFRAKVVALLRGVRKLAGRIGLTGRFAPPDRRRRDLDNVAGKALLDALKYAGAYDDDSQIKVMHVEMCDPDPPDGSCHIRLEELDHV